MKLLKKYFIIVAFIKVFTSITSCNFSPETSTNYLNLNDTAQYVGMQTCRACHESIYQTFRQTGMGKSFDLATKSKSDGIFDSHAIVHDEINDFYYKPFWRNDSLFIKEFRLKAQDTIYKRIEHISYIIGSGQHTNSHMVNFNGFVYQAPITFYTQTKEWDMAPGFDNGFNTRFNRAIKMECMTCHNGYPKHNDLSENKYDLIKTGIDCERCHGPGSIHVANKLKGNIGDTALEIDYTIVNPKDLSIDRQMDLCQRCHLQGIAILEPNKTFEDFKPAMQLNTVMNTFLPRFKDETHFIMASQADRLKQSKCFIQSKQISCITCHNPHISVKVTSKKHFNAQCQTCHPHQIHTKNIDATNSNCIDCHMPKSGSIDIPHVAITDHKIQIPNSQFSKNDLEAFIGLVCLTKSKPDDLTQARAYIAYYEKYAHKTAYLDSANIYLKKCKQQNSPILYSATQIHYLFLKEDFDKIISLVKSLSKQVLFDSWTYYRIGEAYYNQQAYQKAFENYSLAISHKSLNLDFKNKLGVTLMRLNKIHEAKKEFESIIELQPKYVRAYTNLGFANLNLNNFREAEQNYRQALVLNPDYEQALTNLAGLLILQKKNKEAIPLLEQTLLINPNNLVAKQLLAEINVQ